MKFQKSLVASMVSAIILTGCGGSDNDSPEIETPVNTAPVAQSDAASTENGVAITIDVLSNDTDADGDALTITSVSDAQFGTVDITDGTITYTPDELAMGNETLTYEISDGEDTASGTIDIRHLQTIALSGIVTDSPVTNADVTITVGENTFTTTTDGSGRFEVSISSDTPDALVSFVGQGVDAQSQVTLTSNGGTFLGLLSAAMTDGERDLNDTESDLTKVTHLSTAQTLLYNDYLSEGGEKTFIDWVKTVFADDIINLAGFIKLLVDNPDYPVPEGETTLSLFADTDMNSQQVIYTYLDDLGLVEENGTFSVNYLDDRRAAIDETLDDPLLRTEFTLDDVSGKTWGEFVLLPRLAREGRVYTFLEDGTGTLSGMLDLTMIPEKKDFLWSLNDGSVDIEFIKDDSKYDDALPYFFSCDADGEDELGLYFDQTDVDAFLNECTDGANSIELSRENVGISYSLIHASGPSKLTVAAYKDKWTSENHEATTLENIQSSMYVINQEEPINFSEDKLASGEWLLPVKATTEFFQDGYTDPIGTTKGPFFYEALRFDNGVITGIITNEQGTYSIADGEVSMTLEGTTVTAKHLFDTEHYSIAMFSTERNDQTYQWTGYFKNTNPESTQNLEMAQALPNIWTVYINDGIEGLFSGGLPTLNGAFGYSINPDGTMRRIYSNQEGTGLKDDAPINWTWTQDGNTLTFNGTVPADQDYSRQRIFEIVNVDDEDYVTVLERFNITGRFSPIFTESRVNVIKLLDWSEIFPEMWENAEFQTGNSTSPLLDTKHDGKSKIMPH